MSSALGALVAAAAAAALAGTLAAGRARASTTRLTTRLTARGGGPLPLSTAEPDARHRRPSRALSATTIRVGCLLAGGLLALAGLGLAGLAAGVAAAAFVPGIVARGEPGSVTRRRRELVAALPLTADLLAAALTAGAEPPAALARVGAVVSGSLGDRLVIVARELSLGADSRGAWAPALVDGGEPLVPVAETFVAAQVDGSTASGRLQRIAAEAREIASASALTSAQRAGVRAVAPLGLCFLPAFVAVGIVPVVASAFSRIAL